VETCLTRIQTYNPKVNAFIAVMRDYALKQVQDLADSSGRMMDVSTHPISEIIQRHENELLADCRRREN
jgi:Asp-tRNA(Asn)/Glu-tRNA(Gln) amidotransferase A subunit family amidase